MKILQVHKSLDIGGVETYLARLSAGLVARGHEVAVLTRPGGHLKDDVVRAGAELIEIPPLPENFQAVVERIRGENFDLVHGHNYRVANFSRDLAAAVNSKYLFSVHGPRHPWQLIPFNAWSKIVIAMSEGDRDNITGLGGIRRNRVRLSFYGVDNERFKPGLDTTAIRQEFSLSEDHKHILYMSRFSNRKARIGFDLMEIMPLLTKNFPEIRLLVVGEGPEKERFEKRISALNMQLGFEAARMIGPRIDVENWMNLAAVFVGTANTALEGMACGANVIAAGRTGYCGPITKANFETARASCFGDHGHPPFAHDSGRLLSDLRSLLNDPKARTSAGEVQEHVAKNYNVASMADGTEDIYRELLDL